jgi:two-component system, NarL family, response regulator NreC
MLMDTRVLLVDDHAIMREGLCMVLNAQPGFTVVGEAEDGHQALELVEKLRPDVVVMDIAMPNLNGAEATRQIKRRFPNVKVIILTMHEDERYLVRIVKAGAIGCVLKRSAATDLVAAVTAATRGESYFSPTMATMMLGGYRMHVAEAPDESDLLTEREREVLQMVAEGKTSQEIADLLSISTKTVQTHRIHILRKLGVHDRTDLVKRAMHLGMISAE